MIGRYTSGRRTVIENDDGLINRFSGVRHRMDERVATLWRRKTTDEQAMLWRRNTTDEQPMLWRRRFRARRAAVEYVTTTSLHERSALADEDECTDEDEDEDDVLATASTFSSESCRTVSEI